MKTALTELIEKLNEEIDYITDNDSKEDRFYRSGCKKAKKIAEKLLDKEKQDIIDANQNGWLDGKNKIFIGSGQDYYAKTFNNND